MIVRTDCRYFRGEKPCVHRRLCEGCDLYEPMGRRILIVKLAAMGDVLRTTPLLAAIRTRHDPVHVTWVVRPASYEMLQGAAGIDRLIALDVDALAYLPAEKFDEVICLDKEPAAIGLAARLDTRERRGFTMDGHGSLIPANEDAAYAYRMGLDDELKFHRNEKTYQEIAFEAAGYPFSQEAYDFDPGDAAREEARAIWERAGLAAGDERVLGLNVGSGDVFAYKGWRVDGFAELADRAMRAGMRVALLGGERERGRIDAVRKRMKHAPLVPDATPSVRTFGAVLAQCPVVVTGDTLAMHVALAVGSRVAVVFGSTTAREIEFYGRGEALVPRVDCHPCYKRTCDFEHTCVDSVTVDDVWAAAMRQWDAAS